MLKALKIGTTTIRVQQPSETGPNMNRRMAITNIEKSSLKLLGIGRKLLDQQMCTDYDSQSESDSSEAVSEPSKSDKSEVFSDTNSLQDVEAGQRVD